jgi:gliding motility-associated lipoprotein GldH
MVVSTLFTSCSKNTVYTDTEVMPGNKWDLTSVLSFSTEITDTLSSNNIFFTIRTGSSYPYRNIFLFVTTTSPEGKTLSDTLQYDLADEKGKRYGIGFGDIRELELPFKTNVFFPHKGVYSFSIRHGMRTEVLNDIYDFGLSIVNAKK